MDSPGRFLVQRDGLRGVLLVLRFDRAADQHHRTELIRTLGAHRRALLKARRYRRKLETRIQLRAEIAEQLEHVVRLAGHRRGILKLRRFGIDGAHIHADSFFLVDDKAAHQHMKRAKRLAHLGRRFLLHSTGSAQILLGQQRLQPVALHHADVRVRRKLRNHHLREPLAERRIFRIVADCAVREVHDGDGRTGRRSALGADRGDRHG